MIKAEDSEVKYGNCPAWSTCVLSVLNGDDLRMAERMMQRIYYRDGDTVFRQGNRVRGLHILCQGLVKMHFITQEGRDLLIRFCRPGETLNGITLEEHAFSAVAVGASTVGFIDEAQAAVLIKRYPKLGLEIERRFAQEGRHLLQRMADLAYDSIEERLAHVLLSLGRRHGVHEEDNLWIDLPLSQQDIADMVGASRQTVNHVLRRLADQGLIHMERCRITILDGEWLRNLKR
jgi:CRP/FNR family transcriptional regulator